jgi:hypothetical protein
MYIVRPGLVIGDGGLFKQMIKKVLFFPIIPLINGGILDIKLIGLNDLIFILNDILDEDIYNKELNVFYKNKSILKDLLKDIAQFYNKKIFFINIPYLFIYNIARLLEILRINIGITSQNIKGLLENNINIHSNIYFKKSIPQILKENLRHQV